MNIGSHNSTVVLFFLSAFLISCGSDNNRSSNQSSKSSSSSFSSSSSLNTTSSSSSSVYSAGVVSLREYGDFPIGVRVSDAKAPDFGFLFNPDEQRLVEQHFDQITSSTAITGEYMHPSPNVYDFQEADGLIEYASQHLLTVHGGPLVNAQGNYSRDTLPEYLMNISHDDPENFINAIEQHVTNVASHFSESDNLVSWNVIDGLSQLPLEKDPQSSLFYVRSGNSLAFIGRAFHAARAAAPNTTLYIGKSLNFGDAGNYNTSQFLSVIKKLKEENVPIDGISITRTELIGTSSISEFYAWYSFKSTVEEAVELGLMVRLQFVDAPISFEKSEEAFLEQENTYCRIVKEYFDMVPDHLRGGIVLRSTYDGMAPNMGALFDSTYRDKPALKGFAIGLMGSASCLD